MDKFRSSRRDFLKGRSLLRSIRDTLNSALSEPMAPSPEIDEALSAARQEHYVEHYTKTAMACTFELMFNLQQYRLAAEMSMRAFDLIDRLEAQLTVYRETSEVSELNRASVSGGFRVSENLFALLEAAQRISRDTQGAFDLTASTLTSLWGFDQRKGRLPDAQEIESTLASVGYQNIELRRGSREVVFLNPETQINLGGIGKGYALDRVASLLETTEINDWVLHGGQSSVIARGSNRQVDQADDGWAVGLTHPTIPDHRLGEVVLRNQALGTSGTARQAFIHAGRRFGHIIDPRTGWPVEHCLSTTVVSRSAALCDALATAFFVMPIDEVEAYCREHLDVGAILVLPSKNGELQNTELVWFNLDESDWKRN